MYIHKKQMKIVFALSLGKTVLTYTSCCIERSNISVFCNHDRYVWRMTYRASWTPHTLKNKYRQQKLVANPQCAAVPLVAQNVISAPASQAFVERLFCGLLTKGTRNRMKKIFVHESVAKSELWWTQWHAVECRLAGFDYLNYRLCVGNWV